MMAYIGKKETSRCVSESSYCGMENGNNIILYLFQPISDRATDSCQLQFQQCSMSQQNPAGAVWEASAQWAG